MGAAGQPGLGSGRWSLRGRLPSVNFSGSREGMISTPFWRPFPKRGRGWGRQGSGEAAPRAPWSGGLKGRRNERKGLLRTWKTAPPPTGACLHPKAFGSQSPNEQRYQRVRKESLKERVGGGRKDEPLNS